MKRDVSIKVNQFKENISKEGITMKKTAAVILALVLAMAMVIPAFADNTPVTYDITSPSNGHTYNVYQIFTGEVSDGVLIDVKWGENGTDTEGDSVPQSILNTIAALNGSDAEKAKYIYENYVDTTATFGSLDDTDTTLAVPSGYYLIEDADDFDGENDEDTLFIIEVISSAVTLSPKAGKTTLDKVIAGQEDVKATTASTGDTINFKVTVTLSNHVSNYDEYKVVITDTLSEGLEYNNDAVITLVHNEAGEDDETVTSEFTKDSDGLIWTCDDVIDIGAGDSDKLVLTYSATLTGSGYENTNEAYCEYSNNPNGDEMGKTVTSEVTVYSFTITVTKVDENNEDLNGAKFKLYKKGTPNVLIGEELDGTGTNVFSWAGLSEGTYILEESGTPAGYNDASPIEFVIDADFKQDGSIDSFTASQGFSVNDQTGAVTKTIQNIKGSALPETGGIGTLLFYVLGSILVLGAFVYLVSKKRASQVTE